ncbi:MAG TPA: universal stress protein [Pirellulales bacterium]|nr:universal stress protein [Pirellulales bacterium]
MSWLPRQCVVVPVDFSDRAFEALDLACELVDDLSKLHVVHVLAEIDPNEAGSIFHPVAYETRRQHALRLLSERMADTKYSQVQIHVEFGDPGAKIAELIQALQADLVVIPSHCRTGLMRLLIGSVAEKVVRLATCPVLVLRKEQP